MPQTARQERLAPTAAAPGGEANTGSNQGSGTSVFYQKSGVDLQFNGIKSENDALTVALDAVSNDVELTMVGGSASLIHVGSSAPTESQVIWIDTTSGAGAYKMKLSSDGGSTWVTFAVF